MLTLHMSIVAVLSGTCDYRLVQEHRYSSLDLSDAGFSTNKSICMNGDFSGAHGPSQSIEAFVAQTEDYVRSLAVTRMLPLVNSGNMTTNMIILDIERPVEWKLFDPATQGCYNATLAAQVAGAVAMRVAVAHEVFPHATIALYGTTVNTRPDTMAGYQRAAALGAFDGLHGTRAIPRPRHERVRAHDRRAHLLQHDPHARRCGRADGPTSQLDLLWPRIPPVALRGAGCGDAVGPGRGGQAQQHARAAAAADPRRVVLERLGRGHGQHDALLARRPARLLDWRPLRAGSLPASLNQHFSNARRPESAKSDCEPNASPFFTARYARFNVHR